MAGLILARVSIDGRGSNLTWAKRPITCELERLAEWRGLRDRSEAFETLAGGFRLILDPSESVAAVADLVARESECCSFYTFVLSIDGPKRRLDVSAGPGGGKAVRALLGIEQ